MSILSTNQKLVRVGKEYSAGNGIEISSYVISYTGDSGQEYIAGENIGINDYVISSRNWTPDITYAAESAFQRANEYTNTQISALSGEVSSTVSQLGSEIDYISGVALTAHQSLDGYLTKASGDEYYQPIGSYATVSQLETTSGEIVNLIPSIEGLATEEYVNEQTSGKADKSEIPDVSQFITNVSAELTYQPIGNYLSSNALEGYATQDWVSEQGYITGVDLTNYYTKTDTSSKEELSAAFANLPQGDAEVNSLVHSNSAEWNNVSSKLDESVFQEASGLFLTAIPQEYITESELPNFISAKLDTTAFSTVSGDFLTNEDLNGYATESFVENVSGDITALIPTNYYPDNNPSGFITGVDLTPYQTVSGMTAYQPAGDYATTAQVDDLSGAIVYVSANAGGVITSYSTAYSHLIPPYGGYVIKSLNGSAISALESYSANRAEYATNASNANSAGYAQTVNVTNLKNQGFVRNLSSEYGTISVVRNNIIDSTNSAITRTGYEGFTSALEGDTIGPAQNYGMRTFSWNISLPNTTFNCGPNYPPPNSIIYYSANTNLTGEFVLPNESKPKVNIDVPNATALSVWGNVWIRLDNIVVSAADTFETVVGELAWASAIPTYQYNNENKISAINGSAIAVGGGVTGEFVPQSAFDELKQSYDALSSLFATYSGQWLLPNEGV